MHDLLDGVLMEGSPTLSEAASKALLDAYGIPVARPYVAASAREAAAVAERIGFPVVLKVLAAGITHKTDVGGVITDGRRFRSLFKHASHDAATRYCFIDYDREMAIVAEAEIDGRRRLLGIGRLASDPDHTEAEFAILIADPWQGHGLSRVLIERCLEIARGWDVDKVWAETDRDNGRMLAVLRAYDFALEPVPHDAAIRGTLELSVK